MSKTIVRNTNFDGKEKDEIRNYILKCTSDSKAKYLDFYGNGEFYRKAKRIGKDVLSIDDGRDLGNGDILKTKFNGIDRRFVSLQKLCKLEMERKHSVIWLDYCSAFFPKIGNDILSIPGIMANKGKLFFTFRVGRENLYPKGTMRKAIDYGIMCALKEYLKEAGLKTRLVYQKSYLSRPKYKGRKRKTRTRMIVIGFNWEKIVVEL